MSDIHDRLSRMNLAEMRTVASHFDMYVDMLKSQGGIVDDMTKNHFYAGAETIMRLMLWITDDLSLSEDAKAAFMQSWHEEIQAYALELLNRVVDEIREQYGEDALQLIKEQHQMKRH